MTDPIDIPAARALCEMGTEQQWSGKHSRSFAVRSRTLIPALCDELEVARKENANWRGVSWLCEACDTMQDCGVVPDADGCCVACQAAKGNPDE